MKLNYKRTFIVGLAFLSICAFWQMYDNVIPLILTNTFHLNETYSGAIMAADNILALVLLPLFGSLSDRTNTKIGKRMPYILFGTGLAIILMNILPMLDSDLTKVGMMHMKKMGIQFNLESPVQRVENTADGKVRVICAHNGEEAAYEADKVLVAIGRKPNTQSLDLEAGGIENDRGRIIVNDQMQTSVPGVYAIGDCVNGYAQLAHTASAMGEVAAENIMGQESHYEERTNPTCVYMEPEAASVGLTEEQAKAQGIAYKVGTFPMAANGKALIINGGEGLVKILAAEETGEVIGMHIIGPRATDLIVEGALAIKLHATITDLIETIHSHPTVSETMREAALDVEGRTLNMPPKR